MGSMIEPNETPSVKRLFEYGKYYHIENETFYMDGTLSPDGAFVLHQSQWVPAQLSPDHVWYAHGGQWHPLTPPSVVLARNLDPRSSDLGLATASGFPPHSTGHKVHTAQSKRNQRNINRSKSGTSSVVCLILILVILWFILDPAGRQLIDPEWFQLTSWFNLATSDCWYDDTTVFWVPGIETACQNGREDAAAVVIMAIGAIVILLSIIIVEQRDTT